METVIISDIHGHDSWKKVVEKHKGASFVFLGDFFDSFSIPLKTQVQNYYDLLEFKQNNPNTIWLLGNHDFSYFSFANEVCSGYNPSLFYMLTDALNPKDWQITHTIGKYLLSHAGVSRVWLDNATATCKRKGLEVENELDLPNIAWENGFYSIFTYHYCAEYGAHKYGDLPHYSPIWIRPHALNKALLKGWKQIVGHTRVDKINTKGNVVLTDCINQYISINNNKIIVYERERTNSN